MSVPVVAIVGRPNVGKSTLFNRLTGGRTAIEDQEYGITRDRLYGKAEWRGREFTLIDTGGITFGDSCSLETQVHRQVELAVEEADFVLMLVDALEGITPLDYEIANYLRKSRKKVLLVVNKAEGSRHEWETYAFYEIGLGEPFPVSASHGLGSGDLLDKVVWELPPEDAPDSCLQDVIKVAVVGRPNVGKSSLINCLLGKERVIVDEEPGTTRDAIDTFLEHEGKGLMLVDTAGLRRRSRIKENVEYYSVLRAVKAARKADVVLVVFDADAGFSEQDQRIVGIAHEAGKGLIFVLNKWDLTNPQEKGADEYRKEIRKVFAFADYAPVLFVSALKGRGVGKITEVVQKVDEESKKRISTPLLNELLQDALLVNPPPTKKGKKANLFYVTQPHIQPPTFVFFVNDPQLIHFSYLRYLENRWREAFGFEGTPLVFKLKPKGTQKRWGEKGSIKS